MSKMGLVYFLTCDDVRVKIGWTGGSVRKRMKDLQTGNPDRLNLILSVPGIQGDETRLHRRFAPDRGLGEWFAFDEPVMTYTNQEADRLLREAIEAGDTPPPMRPWYPVYPEPGQELTPSQAAENDRTMTASIKQSSADHQEWYERIIMRDR